MSDMVTTQNLLWLLSKCVSFFFIFILLTLGEPDILEGITKILVEISNLISRIYV